MDRIRSYTINLNKIRGSGEFKCPRCGIKISPDDQTEDVYTVLETVTKDDHLEKIILKCNRCGSQVQLIGFHVLAK